MESGQSHVTIAACTDIHADVRFMRKFEKLVNENNPDVVVCCGDLTIFEQHLSRVLKWISGLHKNVLVIHGNHETEDMMNKLCKNYGVRFLHGKSVCINGVTFCGWGGGGFSMIDREFDRAFSKISFSSQTVLVTHAPPHGTTLDNLGRNWGYVGNKSLTAFVKSHSAIRLVLCGHIHENFGKHDKIGTTAILNPGPAGKIIKL